MRAATANITITNSSGDQPVAPARVDASPTWEATRTTKHRARMDALSTTDPARPR